MLPKEIANSRLGEIRILISDDHVSFGVRIRTGVVLIVNKSAIQPFQKARKGLFTFGTAIAHWFLCQLAKFECRDILARSR